MDFLILIIIVVPLLLTYAIYKVLSQIIRIPLINPIINGLLSFTIIIFVAVGVFGTVSIRGASEYTNSGWDVGSYALYASWIGVVILGVAGYFYCVVNPNNPSSILCKMYCIIDDSGRCNTVPVQPNVPKVNAPKVNAPKVNAPKPNAPKPPNTKPPNTKPPNTKPNAPK